MMHEERKIRDLKRHLRELTDAVAWYLKELDLVMLGPSTQERGSTIALMSNRLEIQNDLAKRYGLGIVKKPRKKRGKSNDK